MQLSRRRLLQAGATAGAGMLASCRPREDDPAGSRTLTVWHPWGGVMAARWERICRAYEAAHPGVKLRTVFVQNNLSANQKFFTAVAAGTPPDAVFVDGPQVASWAEWGALQPLRRRVEGSGIRPGDYFPPTWAQNLYRDEIWAVTYSADPNFGFAYNRAALRKAGMDPDRPPTNIEELTEMAHRLTRRENGVLRQIGLIPWAQYGPANSMYTWGWAFGGDFYEPATQKITADHPRVVKALEWMITFARQYDPAQIASLQAGFGTAEQDPFYTGQMALRCLHIGGIGDIERYAPNLDYEVVPIPSPPDGEQRSSWVGGWCVAIPHGSRKPDEAWEFIRWLCHSPEGTATVGREASIFPGMRHSPYFEETRSRRYYGDYVRILEEARHQRPVMPVQAYYMNELQRAVENAVYGRKEPAEALAAARRNTQNELEMVLAG